jgi:hypothetical protein
MPAASAAKDGSILLGVAVHELEGLAASAGHRKARNSRGLASQGLSPLLELDFQAKMRPSGSQLRDSSSNPEDGLTLNSYVTERLFDIFDGSLFRIAFERFDD